MKSVAAILSIFILAVGCQNNSEVENLKKEVLEIHDRVMAQHSEISQLQKKLEASAKGAADSVARMNAAMELHEAHARMMDWMHSFESPDEKADWTKEQKIGYLKEEKQEMQDIEALTNRGIGLAKEILAKTPVVPKDTAAADSVAL